MYPEHFPPARFPDKFCIPTHIVNPVFQKTVTADSAGKFAIYFCPIATVLDPMYHGLISTNVDTAVGSDAHVWYADRGTSLTEGLSSTGFPLYTNFVPP